MSGLPMITHVAILHRGKVYSLPAPARHHHVIVMINDETGERVGDEAGSECGFLDSAGRFLRRKPALSLAKKNGQFLDPDRPRSLQLLFSEDLW